MDDPGALDAVAEQVATAILGAKVAKKRKGAKKAKASGAKSSGKKHRRGR